jgi:flavin reductase (NADH)
MRTDSRTCNAVQRRKHFAVNLLNEDASEVAKLFSSYDPDRFGRVEWSYSPTGLPWLMGYASGVADCMVAKEAEVGDHTVVFGRLQRLRVGDGRPLMYGMRRFFMSPHASAELASGAEGWPPYLDVQGVWL